MVNKIEILIEKELDESSYLNKQDKDKLEGMIDKNSLGAIMDALGDICYEKAEHIRTNWQDERLATFWDEAGERIILTGSHIGNI